ncbi:MAG TPA: alkaline phosphatase family protein [Pyrinomonadaceae bacterium]|nr:alkaline phosphatase family protein [Pyrinomonadaceae bacterium]
MAILIVVLLGQLSFAQNKPTTRPRLVLIIVADQFRFDYLTRFGPLFGKGGFRRLLNQGASWTNANFDYVPTKTSPGHAAIVTGAPPSVTGIIANEWIERSTATKVTSVGDRTARVVGGENETPNSPRRLLASTVGDELRSALGDQVKVIGVSDKPRAAILPAGKRANAAYWLGSRSGNIISSDYYFKQLPEWVEAFNRTRPLDKYFGARWERLLPEREYLKHAGPDSPPWEVIDRAPGFTNVFPHVITGGESHPGQEFYDALDHSPFVNDVIVAMAEQVIAHEKMGEDETTDLLSVSLSGTDHVGHRFGPTSQELMDTVLRLDRQIARLLDFVDARVGLKNTLVAFSSDHGVAPLWQYSETKGGLGRTRITNAQVMEAVHRAIKARYGAKRDYIFQYKEGGQYKDAVINGNIYFNLDALARDHVSLDEITQLAGDAVAKLPGIAGYYTRSQLENCRNYGKGTPNSRSRASVRIVFNRHAPCLADLIGSSVLRGFDPERNGDLIIVQKQYYYLGDSSDPTSHATPYPYDTHVPVILMGGSVKPGTYQRPATPADIAPTLSLLLGIKPPDRSQARVLKEALR